MQGHRGILTLGSIVVGDDSKVADSGSLTFSGFDGVSQPHLRSSTPKDRFPSFLVLSSRSYPCSIASGGGGLVHAVTNSVSRV
jgi:hypothetical protein